MANHVYFPVEYQELVKELMNNHRDLAEKLNLENLPLEEALGTLAAEFNILCNGEYELADICRVLLLELKKRSTSIIYLPPGVAKH